MFDQLLTIAIQHYVIVGFVGIVIGFLANVIVTGVPEVVQAFRTHKLY